MNKKQLHDEILNVNEKYKNLFQDFMILQRKVSALELRLDSLQTHYHAMKLAGTFKEYFTHDGNAYSFYNEDLWKKKGYRLEKTLKNPYAEIWIKNSEPQT